MYSTIRGKHHFKKYVEPNRKPNVRVVAHNAELPTQWYRVVPAQNTFKSTHARAINSIGGRFYVSFRYVLNSR
jgi:hypothetical protein